MDWWGGVFIHSLPKTYSYTFIFIYCSILSAMAAVFVGGCGLLSIHIIAIAMGNKISSSSNYTDDTENMALRLDLYAQRIIMKEVKFNSSLSDSGKCEKLIIITSEVLNRLPFRLISYMDRRHKLFSEKYETFNAMDRALLVNTNPEILKESKLDEPNEFRKRQMCVGLARFYVQIGNLFNAIMSTMRPYNYENTRRTGPDNFYDMLAFSLLEGRKSTTGSNDKLRYETSNMSGFAKKQADMKKKLGSLLKFGEIVQDLTPGEGICNVQKDIEDNKITPLSISGSSSTESKIKPSIFAMLEELYYDIFHQSSSVNPKSPQFIAMTAVMKENIYRNDVRELYRIVTGGKEPGPEIKTFTDVSKYVNDNEEIKKWCSGNKNLKIKVTDDLRRDSAFVEYVKHIKDTMAYTSKQRKGIVGLLDRVFVTMKKSEDELREIEETWYKSSARRYEGFERDDEYAREFFKLNLKYDFFINPNLTDADLQVITNEARTRIVRLYADSYQRFLKGFQILQKIQANTELTQLEMAQNIAKDAQQQPQTSEKEKPDIKWDSMNLREEKTTSDTVQRILSEKDSGASSIFRDLSREIYDKGSDDKFKDYSLFYLKKLNGIARQYIDKDRFDSDTVRGIKFQLNQLKAQYDNYTKPQKDSAPQQAAQPNIPWIV